MTSLRQLAACVFRLTGLAVLCLVLLFPAWKHLWLGYVPVALGLALAWWLRRGIACGRFDILERGPAWAFGVFAFALPALVQVVLLLALRPLPMFDGQFVYAEAVTLLRTGHLSPLTYYPPLQAVWYAAWFKLFGVSPLVAQLSHVPLSLLVTGLTYGLARKAGARPARLIALLVAYYPSFLAYVLVTPYYHYLYTAAVVATAWGWVASVQRARSAAAAGLASGLGALAKATQLIAVAQGLVFWLLVDGLAWRRRVGLWVLFGAVMAIAIVPWTLRNQRVFGAFVPVCTSGGLVLYSANNPESNGLYSGLPDTVPVDSPQAMLAHSRASAEKARQFIREQPAAFLRLAWIKVLHTWGGEATFAELINSRGRPLGRVEDLFSVAFFTGWVLVVGLWAAAASGALRDRIAPTPLELACAVVVVSNLVVYAVFEGGDRHHLPFVPLLVACALAGVAPRTRLATRASST